MKLELISVYYCANFHRLRVLFYSILLYKIGLRLFGRSDSLLILVPLILLPLIELAIIILGKG